MHNADIIVPYLVLIRFAHRPQSQIQEEEFYRTRTNQHDTFRTHNTGIIRIRPILGKINDMMLHLDAVCENYLLSVLLMVNRTSRTEQLISKTDLRD